MLLENLFFAELEESTAHSGDAAQSPEEQGGEEHVQHRQQRTTTSARFLKDSGKVAEIKKLLNDVVTGKTDLSDLPKAMAGSGETRPKAGTAPKSESRMTARSAADGVPAAAS